ncbi:MAG: DUF4177 domain-containing protein [Candidatus Hodarchaeota archaeon]
MQQYEYRIVDLKKPMEKNEAILNEQGTEGWELVQILVIPVPLTSNETLLKAVFKRLKKETELPG